MDESYEGMGVNGSKEGMIRADPWRELELPDPRRELYERIHGGNGRTNQNKRIHGGN